MESKKNLCFVFIQQKVLEFWTLIYIAVEIRVSGLCPHREVQGKHYTMMDLLVHDEQIEPSLACFSCEL